MHVFVFRCSFPSPQLRCALLPSPRARSAWRGGVGGGGCLSVLNINMGTRGDTPHPRPLPAATPGEGRRSTGAAESTCADRVGRAERLVRHNSNRHRVGKASGSRRWRAHHLGARAMVGTAQGRLCPSYEFWNFEHTASRSRGAIPPELCQKLSRLNIRGRRECRMRAAPAVPCAKRRKKTHTSIQVQRRHSDIPCAMVLRFTSRSPRRSGLLDTVAFGYGASTPGRADAPPKT
jgi:hypothetical protein